MLTLISQWSEPPSRNDFLQAISYNWTSEAAPRQLLAHPPCLALQRPATLAPELCIKNNNLLQKKHAVQPKNEDSAPGSIVCIKVIALCFGTRFEFVDSSRDLVNSEKMDILLSQTYNQYITAAILHCNCKE
jgi:hypothetical protein